ncbi:MAG: glycosyltransferase family 39 protein [Treponematales bacterium]
MRNISIKSQKLMIILAVAGIAGAGLLFISPIRTLLIDIAGLVSHKSLSFEKWNIRLISYGIDLILIALAVLFLNGVRTLRINLGEKKNIVILCLILFLPLVMLGYQAPLAILRTFLAACLLAGSFVLLLLNIRCQKALWRDCFITASLYYSAFVWALTEVLGFFKMLNFTFALAGWLIFTGALLIRLMRQYKTHKQYFTLSGSTSLGFMEWTLAIILCVTFFIAVAYPPNNWDSMTYHLPRVEHWIQNKSLAHFYTSIIRQTMSAPFAEICILHGRLLSGGNWLMNLVQWCFFAGSLVAISSIASSLGLDKKQQTMAALFFATVPMAILQASSTQTDMAESFWIVCAAERLLVWKREGRLSQSLHFGIALGMAALTKGTAYPIALPLVTLFAFISIRNFRCRLPGAFMAAIIALVINMPHYTRNYSAYGNPLGVSGGTVSDYSLKSFLVTFPADIYINAGVPMPKALFTSLTSKVYGLLGIDRSAVFPYKEPVVNSVPEFLIFHEDSAKNPIHMILVIIAIVLLCYSGAKRFKMYMLLVLASWLVFAFCIPYQPWVTRLQLPLFALSAPLFPALFVGRNKEQLQAGIVWCISVLAMLPLFMNVSRPLSFTLWTKSRYERIFENKPHLFQNYYDACLALEKIDARNIGLVIGGDTWEYPLWAYPWKEKHAPRIFHVQPEDLLTDESDALFVLNSTLPSLDTIITDSIQDDQPWVLRYGKDSNWEIVFSPAGPNASQQEDD